MKAIAHNYDGTAKADEFIIGLCKSLLGESGASSIQVEIDRADEKRNLDQNALSHAWYNEVEKSGYERARDARRYCKLHFGVPILRAEDSKFQEFYDRVLKKNLSYEQKLEMMDWFPVTSLMGKNQMTRYLENVQQHYASEGVVLESRGEYAELTDERKAA